MIPVNFHGVTRVLPPCASGDDGDPHLELPIAQDGFRTESVWVPSPEEREVLAMGGGVKLQFRGAAHPAVLVSVARADEFAA